MIVHKNQHPFALLLQPADLRSHCRQLRPAIQVVMLGRSVSLDPPGVISSLKSDIGQRARRTKKSFFPQACTAINTGKCNACSLQVFRRFWRKPIGTVKLGNQGNSFERISKETQFFEVAANKTKFYRELRQSSRQLARILQRP